VRVGPELYRYVGADGETVEWVPSRIHTSDIAGAQTVEWSQVSDPTNFNPSPDGCATNEPKPGEAELMRRIAETAVQEGTRKRRSLKDIKGVYDQSWVADADGSAANEPVVEAIQPGASGVTQSGQRFVNTSDRAIEFGTQVIGEAVEQRHRLNIQQQQIGRLICERDQLQREVVTLRELLSRLPDGTEDGDTPPPTDHSVHTDIERTIDHLLNGRTTKDQRRGLNSATERADRVRPDSDAAVGRALR
jgi:hypothetical protein